MATYTYDILASGIEQGTIGQIEDEPSDTRVRSVGYIELHKGASSVVVSGSSTAKTIQVAFRGYSNDDKNSLVCNLYWYDSPHTFDLSSYSNIKYFRVVIKYSDNSNITPSEVTSASLTETYPAIWGIEDDTFTHSSLPAMIPQLVQPYPPGIWYIEDGIFKHVLLPSMIGSDNKGAFCGVNTLVSVKIPKTVQQIGSYSFSETGLTSVKISQYCNYESTSFPEDCEITYYE